MMQCIYTCLNVFHRKFRKQSRYFCSLSLFTHNKALPQVIILLYDVKHSFKFWRKGLCSSVSVFINSFHVNYNSANIASCKRHWISVIYCYTYLYQFEPAQCKLLSRLIYLQEASSDKYPYLGICISQLFFSKSIRSLDSPFSHQGYYIIKFYILTSVVSRNLRQ